jgi:chemotaxis methyl-accepting protein methylase
MKVSAVLPCKNLSFGSNSGAYRCPDGNLMGTYTNMFRADLDWEVFTNFLVKHFKNKDKVQLIQFASSDGSEAYTQVISLLEQHKKDANKFLPINAYDINDKIYKIAKSGFINLNDCDMLKIKERNININKYFKKTDKTIHIPNDSLLDDKFHKTNFQAYEVSNPLKNSVKFHKGDMFDVLKDCDDNSNTVILCRNVLDYLSDREIDRFTTYAAYKLKKGSLFVIGEIDNPKIDNMLKIKGFIQIMPNVYMQS